MYTAFKSFLMLSLLLGATPALAQEQTFKPFVLASVSDTTLAEATSAVLESLETAGWKVAGRYTPLPETHIIVVTSDELLAIAGASDRGAYAAGQRISISKTGESVEVGFVNPLYIQHAYLLEGRMQGVHDKLVATLGMERYCGGGEKKMTARKLRKYNYMIGMQHFDDPSELGTFDSHDAAVTAVENGLANEDDGLTMIYRIDLPGGNQTVFGVGMKPTGEDDRNIDEGFQMGIVDFEGCSKKAYFPYEVLVNGNEVEALHMRFRMAVHFPNLSMMGKHGFTKLLPFPKAIEKALEKVVEGGN